MDSIAYSYSYCASIPGEWLTVWETYNCKTNSLTACASILHKLNSNIQLENQTQSPQHSQPQLLIMHDLHDSNLVYMQVS